MEATKLFGEESRIIHDSNLQLLLLAGITAPLGVSLLSPILNSLIDPLSASTTSIGLLVTAYTAPALVVVPLSGILADRYGRKPILISGLVIFGSAGVAIGLTTNFTFVLLLRACQGIGYAGVTPIVIASLGDLYTDTAAATAQGLRMTSVGITQTIFPLLAGVLVVVAWQLPFLIYGMALPIAILVYLFFSEPTARDEIENDSSEVVRRSYLRNLLSLLVRPPIPFLLIAYCGPTFLYFGFHAYISIIVVQVFERVPRDAGLVVAIFSLIYAGAASQSGRLTDWFGNRVGPLFVANLILMVGLGWLVFVPSFLLAFIGITGVGVGFGILNSVYRSLLTDLVSETFRGGLISTGEALSRAAGTIAPVLISVLIAISEPSLGFVSAVQWSVFGVGVLTGVTGIGGVLSIVVMDGRE